MASTTAEIVNIGAIERLTIPIPERGGLVILRGRNGCGKSTALEAINTAVTGNGKPPVRDNCLRGEFSGMGVTLTIGKSKRRSGEAEVHSLEGRLSVADLVDPGIKEPAKADAHRIKALVQLVGAKADPSLFYDVVGGREAFDATVSPAAITHSDLLMMAGAIKRDLEAAARKSAASAENARKRAQASRQAIEGIDLDADCDAAALQRELEEAVESKARLESQAAEYERADKQGKAAAVQLQMASEKNAGLHLDVAREQLESAVLSCEIATTAVAAAEEELRRAKHAAAMAIANRQRAEETVFRAESHETLTRNLRQQIEAANQLKPVSAGDLVRVRSLVDETRERLEQAAVVRRAKEQAVLADQLDATAIEHAIDAERMRSAAHGIDDVLTGVVARSGVPLRIEPVNNEMRLTVATGRGQTCFGELSDGERWRIALDIAIKAVGPGGMLHIPQHAFEALDPVNRRAIAEQLRAGGVIGFAAEATDGDLRAEVYGGAA